MNSELRIRLLLGADGARVQEGLLNASIGAGPLAGDDDARWAAWLETARSVTLPPAPDGDYHFGGTLAPASGWLYASSGGNYVTCVPYARRWTAAIFSIAEIRERGAVSENHCGVARAPLAPGMLVLFVRPLTAWENVRRI